MNLIAGLFASLMAPLFTWFITLFTRKVLTVSLSLATFILLTVFLVNLLKGVISQLLGSVSLPDFITSGIGLFVPHNFVFVLSSIISAYGARWAYDIAVKKITLINNAT